MEVEAALLPPSIRLNASVHQYAFRALKLSPSHPVHLELGLVGSQFSKNIPITQLERIKKSILGLADLDTLEPIQHFKYSPWNKDTPYTVEISDLPKDKAALAHNQSISLGKGICIYTDASAIPDNASTGIGVGLAAYCLDNSQSTQRSSNLGPYQLVYNGELEGITQAVEYTSEIVQPGQVY